MAEENKAHGQEQHFNRKLFRSLGKAETSVTLLLIVLIVVLCIIKPTVFPTVRNLFNILRQFSQIAIIGVGMSLVIITGGIDLSVGSIVALSACLGAAVNKQAGGALNPLMVLLVIILTGAAMGFLNGFLIAKVGIPPFIATLGMLSIGNGFALLITNGSPIRYEDTWISVFGGGYIGPVPITVLVMVAVLIFGFVFSKKTVIGRDVYAVGNSARAATLSGINVDRTLMIVYVITGILCSICGLILLGQLDSADQSYGKGGELDVIAACVIGGISMTGGEGSVLGVVVGAALMGVLKNMFVMLAVSGYWQTIIIGAVIIGAVALDSLRKKSSAK